MKILVLMCLILLPGLAKANFLFQYGLNYSSEADNTSDDDYTKQRTFHKILLAASVNTRKTLFFGWNINSWSSSLEKNALEDKYSVLEMGPGFTWFFSDNYNGFFSLGWNPYAKGDRDKNSQSKDITGSSYTAGLGYRFKLGPNLGLGAGMYYHVFSLEKETVNSTETTVSDSVTHIMPMLELTIITR